MRGRLSLGILGRGIAGILSASVRGIFWGSWISISGRKPWVWVLVLERGGL